MWFGRGFKQEMTFAGGMFWDMIIIDAQQLIRNMDNASINTGLHNADILPYWPTYASPQLCESNLGIHNNMEILVITGGNARFAF